MDTTRETLAAALSTVEGIKGYEKRPKALRAGDSWSLVDVVARGPGQAWQTTWRIALVIGPDEATAVDQLDKFVPLVVDALVELVYVDSARPLLIPVEQGNNLYGIEFVARSE
ncbi:hypothetical protein [Kribbella sp. NPDC051770]|uniref:hypothetical protein n=1 Tax=Kribbella sp. NPDC051770 TaxID=3155413 RepID=UPI00341CECCE